MKKRRIGSNWTEEHLRTVALTPMTIANATHLAKLFTKTGTPRSQYAVRLIQRALLTPPNIRPRVKQCRGMNNRLFDKVRRDTGLATSIDYKSLRK